MRHQVMDLMTNNPTQLLRHWQIFGDDPFNRRLDGINDLLIHPAQQVIFTGEIEVKCRPGDPRRGGNLVQRRGLIALLAELVEPDALAIARAVALREWNEIQARALSENVLLLRHRGCSSRTDINRLTTALWLPAFDLRRDFLGEETHVLFYVIVRKAVIAERAVDLEIADHLAAMAQCR